MWIRMLGEGNMVLTLEEELFSIKITSWFNLGAIKIFTLAVFAESFVPFPLVDYLFIVIDYNQALSYCFYTVNK